MKLSSCFVLVSVIVSLVGFAHADVTIVQKTDGAGMTNEITMKIKEGKARMDINPQTSAIVDTATGDLITVMHAQKMYMKIPASMSKSMIEMMAPKTQGGAATPAPPKFVATGRKEKINGYDTEEYTTEFMGNKASYWVAKNFPNAPAILKQMQSMQKGPLGQMAQGMGPKVTDLPGLPIRTEMEIGGSKVSTTIVSVKEGPIPDSDFELPADYKAMAAPAMTTPPAGGGVPAPPAK